MKSGLFILNHRCWWFLFIHIDAYEGRELGGSFHSHHCQHQLRYLFNFTIVCFFMMSCSLSTLTRMFLYGHLKTITHCFNYNTSPSLPFWISVTLHSQNNNLRNPWSNPSPILINPSPENRWWLGWIVIRASSILIAELVEHKKREVNKRDKNVF